MDMLIFWTSAFILCTEPLTRSARGTVETGMIDPFDFGRTDTSAGQETKEWLDPFDMTSYSHGEKKMVNQYHTNKVCKTCQCEKNEMEKNFLQRLVNLLINHCENDGAVMDTSILLTVMSNQLRELHRVKDAADSEAMIRVLNGIFSSMTVHEESSSFIMDIFISEEVWSKIPAMSFALLPLCIFITGGTMRRLLIILALSAFAVSYFKTQALMLKKLEVENEHTLMRQTECSPHRRPWFNIFGSDNEAECLKQLHAQKIDPSLEVTPIKVISHMTAVGLLQPMEHFGIVFSSFSKQIFESHSMLYGMLVFTSGAFIVIYVITVCCAGIFGRNFSVGNRHISLGMTDSAEGRHAPIEAAPESKVAAKPNTEISVINHGHPPQPVIQIIHNYPVKHVEEPLVRNDYQMNQLTSEKNISNNNDLKSEDSVEDSHKICEVIQGNSSTKCEILNTTEPEDNQKKEHSV